MSKQTFTAGQVLTAAEMNQLQENDYNWTVSTKTASYTLAAGDEGTRIVMDSASATTITVDDAIFSAGDTVWLHNIGAGTCTITAGTATVDTAAALELEQWEGATLYFTAASSAILFRGGGGASGLMNTSSTPPSDPSDGDMWYDTDDGRTYVYYDDGTSAQWVEFGAPPTGSSIVLASYADSAARAAAIPTPTEADLSYLQDTNKVEVYDGSAWTGVGGLVPLVTEDFSSVANIRMDNLFTADYRAYKIVLRLTAISTDTLVLTRLRSGGVSKTANYTTQRFQGYGTTVGASSNPSGTDDWYLGTLSSTYGDRYLTEMTLFDPYSTNTKLAVAQTAYRSPTSFTAEAYSMQMNDTDQLDGISFFPNVGTISGTVTVYGMTEAT